MYTKLSVLIPVYNEKNTIKKCVDNVMNSDTCGMELEVIISDNNSQDGTKEILETLNDKRIKVLFKDKNTGKGANIKNALNSATGQIILFQDGDLEYSPKDYPDLLKPFFELNADVVYGSRFTRSKVTRIIGFPNYIANNIFTFLANMLYNRIFTDIATGYKVFKASIINSIQITSDGFEIEPEITAKISRINKINIYEVPISINSRDYEDGKKVRWWHFFTYVFSLIKWRFLK
tara:strand:- start:412 stop:1113 length:702 start_codon:yes stop_codon:yes gene_type:complete